MIIIFLIAINFLVILFMLLAILSYIRSGRRRRKLLCTRCGYDMSRCSIRPQVCPECGRMPTARRAALRMVALITAGGLLSAASVAYIASSKNDYLKHLPSIILARLCPVTFDPRDAIWNELWRRETAIGLSLETKRVLLNRAAGKVSWRDMVTARPNNGDHNIDVSMFKGFAYRTIDIVLDDGLSQSIPVNDFFSADLYSSTAVDERLVSTTNQITIKVYESDQLIWSRLLKP